MTKKNNNNSKVIAPILDSLVQCHSTQGFKDEVLPALCDFFSATTAVIHYYAGDSEFGSYYDPIYVNVDSTFVEKYGNEFSDQDPFPLAALRGYQDGKGNAFSSSQLTDMAEFSQSEFYLKFLKPQKIYRMLIIVITRDNSPFAFLGLHRDRDTEAFTAKEIDLADQLSPYLSAVVDRVHMADELSLYKRVVDTLSYGLMNKGVLIVDHSLTLVYANDYAVRAFKNHIDFNPVHRNIPEPIKDAFNLLLSKGEDLTSTTSVNFTIEGDAPEINGYVRANHSEGSPPLLLAFFNSVEFGVINPKACEEFGLSARELDVVRCVIEGKTNSEVAEELFISVRTVQNHLRSIYSKCEVHNRTSLSNRVLSLV